MYPSRIPDLLSESPLIVSGRYRGAFPETLTATGILADTSNFFVELKVHKAKDIPLDKVITFVFFNIHSCSSTYNLFTYDSFLVCYTLNFLTHFWNAGH